MQTEQPQEHEFGYDMAVTVFVRHGFLSAMAELLIGAFARNFFGTFGKLEKLGWSGGL